MLYLDYLATTPVLPQVVDDMHKAFLENYANPSSNHNCGEKSAEVIEKCKQVIADKVGAYPSEIIFTSGATEANNLAIKGIAQANKHKGNHIITSAIEHKCVLNICHYLEQNGFDVTYLMPTKEGIITAESVRKAITDNTILVSIMHVNNELGSINPIEEIGNVCLDHNIPFHSDVAQSFCKLDIDVIDMNLEAMSVSAHKFGGPKGIGFAYIRDARYTSIVPTVHGSGHQHGLRGGTLPTPLIVGLTSAIDNFVFDRAKLKDIKNKLINNLNDKGVKFKLNVNDSLENVINIRFDDKNVCSYLMTSNDVCISQGSACTSKEIKASHVLLSIGLSEEEARNTFRISFINDDLLKLNDKL